MPDPAAAPSEAKVAWLSGAFGYGGELMYFEQIFAELARRIPHAAVLVAEDFPVDRYPQLPLQPILDFHVFGRAHRSVGEVTYTSMRRVPTLASLRRIRALRPDVLIITETSLTAISGFLLAKLSGIRVAMLVESDPRFRGAPGGRTARAVKRFIARGVNAILVSNQAGLEYLVEVVGAPREKILVGPYLTSHPAGTAPQALTREETGEDRTRLLFINSLNPRKGVKELLTALALTDARVRDRWVLDIVGDGPSLDDLQRLADELGLAGNCVFHGRVAYREIGSFYRDCDLVISPTLADYRSLGGFEAVNAGKPLLTSVHDGASRELAALAPAVEVIDPRDPHGLAAVVNRYLAGDGYLQERKRAAADVPEWFSVTGVGQNLTRLVGAALVGRTGRRN